MSELNELVFSLDKKIKNLIEIKNQYQRANEELLHENSELDKINYQQQIKINQLENNIKVLTITKSLETGKNSVDAKLKINEFVREIEKCVALLNK